MDKVSFHLNTLHASSGSFSSRQVLSDSHFSSPCIIFNCVYLSQSKNPLGAKLMKPKISKKDTALLSEYWDE